ncbi:hypothetical protein AK830_g4517 [Neonectria ditissima]|uniref:Uncharacterized protein n=1 Tax=Neonectria ditissima TaxID=78410 RepID=A0A0P7B870_9HYPO|nr:hypothetical protein AK830_g4517 [Neonectria ditissima]
MTSLTPSSTTTSSSSSPSPPEAEQLEEVLAACPDRYKGMDASERDGLGETRGEIFCFFYCCWHRRPRSCRRPLPDAADADALRAAARAAANVAAKSNLAAAAKIPLPRRQGRRY